MRCKHCGIMLFQSPQRTFWLGVKDRTATCNAKSIVFHVPFKFKDYVVQILRKEDT